jgi:tetratricopeptide (TPR) repeat protein
MKKFFVLFAAVCFTLGAHAQMGKVNSALSFIEQGALDKAKENLDIALANEKSMNNPKTYTAKGKLCQEVFKSDNPKFKALYKDPLAEAYEAYEKALKLDPKGGTAKQYKISQTYLSLGNDFINQGIKQFNSQDFEGAFKSFDANIKVASSENYIGVPDSGIYFNAAIAALNAKMYDKAIPYFKKCEDIKYNAITPYLLEYQTQMAIKDTTNGEEALKRAFKAYPDSQNVLLNLVDHYMRCNRLNEAFSYINVAKQKDPNSHSLAWAEGVLYMKQEKWDNAITALGKSIELKGDLFDTQFNMGVCYYNKAVEMFLKANEIVDAAKFKVAQDEANAVFVKAIPYFEKANTLKPDDTDSLRNLKELYFRLRTAFPEYQAKYDEVMKKLQK